jgi:hypothetical protein
MPELDFLLTGPETGPLLVLAHGAGAAMDSPFMESAAAGLGRRGVRVARFEFPHMRQRRADGRRRPPDREAVLLQSWREAVAQLGGGPGLSVGGKSMGGRMASMVADEVGARGLVCLGYPFHAPGRPDRPRIAHLAGMTTPALIIQGTRDPFGPMSDVASYPLSAAIRIHWLQGADHDFRPDRTSGQTRQQLLDDALDSAAAFVNALPAFS